MAFCDSPAVGVLENHPNKSDSKAHRASPELGASLGQVTEKKQNKQRGENSTSPRQSPGDGCWDTWGLFPLVTASVTEQDSAKPRFLSLHA